MSETLNGLIERVTYHNPENGFVVLRVNVKGRDDLVTVVGNTTSVSAGEHVQVFFDLLLGFGDAQERFQGWAAVAEEFHGVAHHFCRLISATFAKR